MATKLKEEFSSVCRLAHYSLSTERQYWEVCRSYIRHIGAKNRAALLDCPELKVGGFLTAMAERGGSGIHAFRGLERAGLPVSTRHKGSAWQTAGIHKAVPPGQVAVGAGHA